MTTGERMKARRKAIGMSAETVASELGLSAATVYRYEKGDIEKIPISVLSRLADILCTTPAYLMGWTNDPEDYEKADELNYLPQGWMEHFDGDVEAAVKAYRAVDEDRAREAALPPGLSPSRSGAFRSWAPSHVESRSWPNPTLTLLLWSVTQSNATSRSAARGTP